MNLVGVKTLFLNLVSAYIGARVWERVSVDSFIWTVHKRYDLGLSLGL